MKPHPKPASQEQETLEKFLHRNGVRRGDWDFVVLADGSGSHWDAECGWGAVAIDAFNDDRYVFAGSMNRGTVNVAELLACIQPLSWLVEVQNTRKNPLRVFLFTDSQYTRGVLQGTVYKGANQFFISVLNVCKRQGIDLRPRWLPREDIFLHTYVDRLSKSARIAMKNVEGKDGEPIRIKRQDLDVYRATP